MFTLGQVPFAASSDWNTPITQGSTYTPLAWPSATGYNYWVNWDEYSPSVYVASASDPIVKVSYPAGWGYPGGTVSIHMPAAADGADGTDGELLVIDGDMVYNFWNFNRTSLTTATAGAFGQENIVTGDGWGSSSPFLSAGITAIGSSMMGGLLVKAETDTGVINHALQLVVDRKLVKSGFTGEAIAGDGGSPTGIVQEGDLIAIPPGTPMPSGLSPLGQEVFIALQTYGAYVVDVAGGATTLRAQENAYDDATIGALIADMNKVLPLLQDVNVAAGGPPVTPPPTTTDPLAPTIAAFSPDSGTVGDGITNASILTLTGTAAAGNTVKVYDGTSLIGTATANSSGAWSLNTGTLSNATHNFTATATTAAGSTSPASSVLSVRVDTVAPAAPTISGFSPDSSPVGDGSTNANTLTLIGTAEANSSVRVLDGTTLLGTTKANASGAWSYTTASLASGAHTFAAMATDGAGNTGAQSAPLTVTVQSQSTSGQDLIANGGFETGDFSGWALSGNVGPFLSYGPQAFMVNSAKSGSYAAGFGPVGSDGKLSQDIPTTAGQHYTLDFWLANASGGTDDFAVKWNGQTLLAMVNQSAQGYTEYKFDVVGTAGTSHLEFDFRQDPSYWSIDSISLAPAGASVPPPPTTTDPLAPTIAAFSPDSGTVGDGITNASILTLTGTAAAGNTVKVYDGTSLIGTATANSSGAWSLNTGTLSNATHNFTATATTAAGSTSPASSVLSVRVDTVAPAAPTISGFSPDSSPVGDGSTNANTLTLTGTAEANSSVRVLDGTTLLGTTKANASGAWSYTTASLASGAHTFAAMAADGAGNTGAQSAPLTVTVQSQSTSGQDLIANGGFETGDFSGWALSGNVGPFLSYGPQAFMVNSAKSGSYAAGFGPVGSDGKLSQDIPTTAGQHYTLDFWLANASGGTDDFAVKWNGQTLLAMVNQSAQGYTEYKFDVVGTAGTSHLEFDFRKTRPIGASTPYRWPQRAPRCRRLPRPG